MITPRHTRLAAAAACLLAACNAKKPAAIASASGSSSPATAETSGTPQMTDGSPHYAAVMKRLDVGGKMLQFQDHAGTREMYLGLVKALMSLRLVDSPELIEKLDVGAVIDASGLAQTAASGSSIRKDGDAWLHRSYSLVPGERQGVTRLLGAAPLDFRAPQALPASADLVVECHLDLTQLTAVIEKMAAASGQAEAAQSWLSETLPVGGNPRDLLADTDLHVVLGIDVSSWKTDLPPPQAVDFIVKIEARKKLAGLFKAKIEEAMGEPQPVGKYRGWVIPLEPLQQPKAVLLADDAGTFTMASSLDYLEKAEGDGQKLAADPSYLAATNHFPKQGNLLLYASPQVPPLAGALIRQIARSQADPAIMPALVKATELLADKPWSFCLAHETGGTSGTGELPFAVDQTLASQLPLLSATSVMFIGARAWKNGSDRAACILNIRNIQQAVRAYSNMNNLNPGAELPWDEIIGPGKFLETKPVCPMGGTYTFTKTIPQVGTLACTCTHADHEPPNHQDW